MDCLNSVAGGFASSASSALSNCADQTNKSDLQQEQPLDQTDAENDFNMFIMPWWRQTIWVTIYVALVLASTAGNVIVIWIVLAHKQMRTITNLFLVNMAVADIIMSSMNVTFNFVFFLNSHWPFGEPYCKIVQFLSVLSVTASIFTLMAISIDRYFAIMHPFRPRMSRKWTLVSTAVIWLVSIILSLPPLQVAKTYTFTYSDLSIRTVCYFSWSEDAVLNKTLDVSYNTTIFVLTYFLPLVAMAYSYTRMAFELWGSSPVGEATAAQNSQISSKKRVVKMMIVIVAIFAICWLPYQMYFLVVPAYPEITQTAFVQEVFLGIYWMAMSNSMYNPMIYYWMNARFRLGFQRALRCSGPSNNLDVRSGTSLSRGGPNQRTLHLSLTENHYRLQQQQQQQQQRDQPQRQSQYIKPKSVSGSVLSRSSSLLEKTCAATTMV